MSNPFKKYSLDNLFFRSFAGLMIVVLAFTVWTSYRISSAEMVRMSTYYQQQFLDKVNNEITSRLSTIEQISLSTSRDNDLNTFMSGKATGLNRVLESRNVKQVLANLTYSMPLIQEIDLYMNNPIEDGVLYNYIQFRALEDTSEEVWSGALSQSDFAWSREHRIRGQQGEIPVLSFARKIVYNDKYLGILVIHIKSDTIKEMLEGSSPGVNRMVLDGTGQYLLTTSEVPDQEHLSKWLQLKKEHLSGARADKGIRLSKSLYVYSELTSFGWVLLEITPWSDITSGSVKLALAIGFIGVGAVLLTLVLTHWLSRQFTKPIKQLVSTMGSYAVGGKVNELPMDYSNEFGALFAGYRKQNERIDELYQSLRERYDQQRKAEISALQANINPHFLYNTLDQMNWMAIAAGHDEMSRILELMGRMFRIGLSNGASFISIEEEITHIESYLEIQQLRWQTGFTFFIDVLPELRGYYLPKIILQPFVENSVMHGFNGRVSGHVEIRIRCVQERLKIRITDNGVGLQATGGPLLNQSRRTGGYGLRNVRDRLEAYFGSPYDFVLQERPEGGTTVEITLPCLDQPYNPADSSGNSGQQP
ncbi:histidine kinase [Paenibacillus albidus]|uniref:Histidine kinase n=1 Tax=Paenibacillus albidus TaxID=2041023 RepID=A0A917CAJ9_9BACL|nr:sensor histidine kinase [Paenibacillus albidus]GGF79563.1 histidine kinase [Paenibacillus albidus]